MAARPWSTDDDAQLAVLHAQGMNCNGIARTMSRSSSTISEHAAAAGLTFDRAAVQAATTARRADLRARRARLESTLLDDADKLRARIWSAYTYIDHGGKDYVRVEWTQDEPSPADQLKLMQAAGVAIDRSLKIAAQDDATGDEPVKALLTGLGQALGLVPPDDTDEP